MFHTSTHRKNWIFESVDKLNELRSTANKAYIEKYFASNNDQSNIQQFLNPLEERQLCLSYEIALMELYSRFQPPAPASVLGTSIAYLKRFYLNTSVMDHVPKDVVYVCLYMACKVEEYNVSITRFVQILNQEIRDKAEEYILTHELMLMTHLNFHLTVHNPYRPLEGFLIDIKTRYPSVGNPESWRPKAEQFLKDALLTDACLVYAPSNIALAAIYHAFPKGIDSYIQACLSSNESDYNKVIENLKALEQLVGEIVVPDKHMIKQIEAKLKVCRNPVNNPESNLYKRKLEEEEVEMEDKVKRKRAAMHEAQKRIEEKILGIEIMN